MKLVEAGAISPDFKVGQYNILDDVKSIDSNIDKHFSLSSILGKGKILIDGSSHGSKVTCVNDFNEPANGVAGCIRNYLQVQNNSVSYQDGSGILYTDMKPYDVLVFIKHLGMFSGFKEDKNINESYDKDWQQEFIQQNSYVHTKEYQDLLHKKRKIDKDHDDSWDRYTEADDWLKKNGTPKPKSEWSEEDEFESILGNRPMTYKDEKKASEYKAIKDKEIKICVDLDHKSTELGEKINQIKLNARSIEKKNYSFSKPKKASKSEYQGFKMETGIAYYDDRLKQGKGYISEMPPKEYLLRCAFQIFPEGTIESTVLSCNNSNIKKYAAKMRSGEKFDMPYLNLTQGEQEGRHRAVAAMLNGYKLIPVYIL